MVRWNCHDKNGIHLQLVFAKSCQFHFSIFSSKHQNISIKTKFHNPLLAIRLNSTIL